MKGAAPVVFITGRDPSDGKGGGSNYVRAHARAATRAGFEPHVFCLAERGESRDTEEHDYGVLHRVASPLLPRGILKERTGEQPGRFLARWLATSAVSPYTVMLHAPCLAARVAEFIAARPEARLMHGFYTWGCAGLMAQRQLRRLGIGTVVVNSFYTSADTEVQAKAQGAAASPSLGHRAVFQAERLWIRHAVRRYERQAYTRSRYVLFNYESVRRLLLAVHGPGAEMRRLPYTAEGAFLREGAGHAPEPGPLATLEPRTEPLILTVSRHDPRKGLNVLIRALGRLRASGVRFRACLVSGGPLFTEHQQLAAQLGLADVTRFTSWVDDSYPYLLHADVFVLPSLQEGSGSISLLEAMQAGVAIVASNIDGIPEDVTDGDSALLVEAGNVDQLSDALLHAVTQADLRRQLARRARETFADRFSAGVFVDGLRNFYGELCERPSRSGSRSG